MTEYTNPMVGDTFHIEPFDVVNGEKIKPGQQVRITRNGTEMILDRYMVRGIMAFMNERTSDEQT